ncbi:hypothetical protein [Devosia sp. CN2-171]|uniref:hypothetical protein n=1 Tax=Devosia sp. CN2-171 TaxID=3400909 RepID=UPI003BF80932
MRNQIASSEFRATCCEFLVRSFGAPTELWNLPLVRLTDELLSARIFVWPSGYENTRHEHNHWSVAGVLLHQIQILIFREGADIEPSVQFTGNAGDVGLLKSPCIHQIRNAANHAAVSFHVFETTEEEADAVEGLSDTVWHGDKVDRYRTGLRRRTELATVEMLRELPGNFAVPLLNRMFGLVGNSTKLAVARAVASFSPSIASEQLLELANAVDPKLSDNLAAIASRLKSLG